MYQYVPCLRPLAGSGSAALDDDDAWIAVTRKSNVIMTNDAM